MSSKPFSRPIILLVALLTLASAVAGAADTKLAAGTAAGSFSAEGKTTKLAYASVFVDQKDERKPTVLILSDVQLPASSWKSETDFMLSKQKFIGVAFWIDKTGEVYRTEYHDGSQFPTSASGIFDLKLDPAKGKDLSGSAVSTSGAARLSHPVNLDVTFHATR